LLKPDSPFEVSGLFPYDIQFRTNRVFLNASAKSPNRVRKQRITQGDDLIWDISPDQYALCSDGRSIPASQAKPLYKECESVLKVLRGEMRAEDHLGNPGRVMRVWEMIEKIRRVWK
jgi:hypothetical protein